MHNPIIVSMDYREKRAWFTSGKYPKFITLERITLPAGDYTNGKIIIEKKGSPSDLCLSLCRKRISNFKRVIRAMCSTYERAFLILSFTQEQLAAFKPFGSSTPADVILHLHDFEHDYPTLNVIWSKSDRAAQETAKNYFYRFPAPSC